MNSNHHAWKRKISDFKCARITDDFLSLHFPSLYKFIFVFMTFSSQEPECEGQNIHQGLQQTVLWWSLQIVNHIRPIWSWHMDVTLIKQIIHGQNINFIHLCSHFDSLRDYSSHTMFQKYGRVKVVFQSISGRVPTRYYSLFNYASIRTWDLLARTSWFVILEKKKTCQIIFLMSRWSRDENDMSSIRRYRNFFDSRLHRNMKLELPTTAWCIYYSISSFSVLKSIRFLVR